MRSYMLTQVCYESRDFLILAFSAGACRIIQTGWSGWRPIDSSKKTSLLRPQRLRTCHGSGLQNGGLSRN